MANNRIVNNLAFNHDFSCFTCALESGFRIFNVDPLVSKLNIGSDHVGSVQIVDMLYRTNILAIVGGGNNPKYAENSVLILDDSKGDIEKKIVIDIAFAQPVLAVRMRYDKIIVVLRNEIHIFSFHNNPKKLATYQTRDNPKGIFEICSAFDCHVSAFPGHRCGTIQILDLSKIDQTSSKSPNLIAAHQNEISAVAINRNGTLVATASKIGTLIRIFEISSKHQLVELRRGADSALLYCLTFSPNSQFICTSSDKGTVHIFAVKDTNLNKRSSLQKMGSILGQYVDSQWGLASFTLPVECPSICAFSNTNSSVYAICSDGTYHKYAFTMEGSCNREGYGVYLDMEDENDF